MLKEFFSVFDNSGYAIFNIEAHFFCAVILIILWVRQQNNPTWSKLLFVQILYCVSGIFRVLADVKILPDTNIINFLVTASNFALFGCICWLVFLYINERALSTLTRKILSALPFAFNVIMLLLSPLTKFYLDISGPVMKTGVLFPLMVAINLAYPVAAVLQSYFARKKIKTYEPMMAIYPAFFMICGPLQALNWRMPFLCYAIVISDIFVYISYADSLVSVDPLTKIPNRNGLMQNLKKKLEEPENLYVFMIDADNLSAVNSNFGRGEGDRALMIISSALSKFQKEEHECYISRYYGDRFIITADISDNDELELFTEHIKNYVSNAAVSAGLAYHLRVNIGYAKYQQYSRTETISGLIEQSERALNDAKEQKRFQKIWRGQNS